MHDSWVILTNILPTLQLNVSLNEHQNRRTWPFASPFSHRRTVFHIWTDKEMATKA
jgi:hypothetical protein